ncbi:TetR/AcrR family transcriptional regulator [Hyphomonadaceae bacterium BL14]|nr:TetR/AcrR family transcriptional regulator [Hyphomonadaceae bacterium BL14]
MAETLIRSRATTQDRLVQAAREVLVRDGFQAFGVNAVAREAGCDKQLIYRYFGGLEGLVTALCVKESDTLAAALEAQVPPHPASDYAGLIEHLVLAYLDALTANPAAQTLVLWELSEPAPALAGFARSRARALAGWIARYQGRLTPPEGIDALAVNALLIATVHQIMLARRASRAGRPDSPEQDAAWARARAALSHIVRQALSA